MTAQRRLATIYALCEADGSVRYVGRTIQNLKHRYRAHRSASERGSLYPVHRWMAKRAREGAEVSVVVLERLPAILSEVARRERHWVQHHAVAGARLLNLSLGGELSGRAGRRSLKEIAAAANRFQSLYFLCERCGASFWRRLSEARKGHARFCSRDCKGLAQRGVSTPLHPAFVAAAREATLRRHALSTRCRKGHAYEGGNVFFVGGSRQRRCRVCHNAQQRAAYSRRILATTSSAA